MNDPPDIATIWRKLSGENNWEGLLDPLDIDLRRYIIHYGEMAQSTYDTFNSSKQSKNCGSSIYSKKDFFSKVGLITTNKYNRYKYRVTKFLYATSGIDVPEAFILKPVSRRAWSKESNFIGFVAVAEDTSVSLLGRRDIVVAWRGSVQSLEWVNNFQFFQVSASDIVGGNSQDSKGDVAKVHQGWYSMYTSDDPRSPFNKNSARDQVVEEIKKLMKQYNNEEISITITGHSMGAALATLNAVDIVANNLNISKNPRNSPSTSQKPCLVTAILLASPRVGDSNFKNVLSKHEQHLKLLRVHNALDVVPHYPPIGYRHVGKELMIDTTKSEYLKFPGTFWNWHNCEAYLHGIAGFNGSEGEFELMVDRDVSLVNKYLDNLKDEYLVPVDWWVLQNKGMVQQFDGSWLLIDHEIDDDDDEI